jgi:GAF domain-containing protein
MVALSSVCGISHIYSGAALHLNKMTVHEFARSHCLSASQEVLNMPDSLMPQSPLPPEVHEENVRKLQAYDILDSEVERSFDSIVHTAARVFRTPTALVSLLDIERQWFKARVGMTCTETPLGQSFCRYAVAASDPMVVLDASEHPIFAVNDLVTGPGGIRFYVGAPIRLPDGTPIGTVCVIDSVPREHCEAEDLDALTHLAGITSELISLRAMSIALIRAQELT